MKRIITFILVLATLLMMTACKGNEKAEIKLGTSDFSIVLPEGYKDTEDNYAEDQIAYYYKDDESIDFDVYQWAKEDGCTLESEAEYYANEYGTKSEPVEINGINGMKYTSEEEYDGYVYTVENYMFEDDSSFVELCFWVVGSDEEYAAVDAIINTLKKN